MLFVDMVDNHEQMPELQSQVLLPAVRGEDPPTQVTASYPTLTPLSHHHHHHRHQQKHQLEHDSITMSASKECRTSSTSTRSRRSYPRIMVGRDFEEQLLLNAYRRRTAPLAASLVDMEHQPEQPPQQPPPVQPQEFVIITGVSGTGKTLLARSLEPRVLSEGGYFCWGKCDQIMPTMTHASRQMEQQQTPFAPFEAAVTQLVTNLLQQDNTGDETQRLKQAIQEAIQDSPHVSGMLLIRLFPVFEPVLAELLEQHQKDGTMSSVQSCVVQSLTNNNAVERGGSGGHHHHHATTSSIKHAPNVGGTRTSTTETPAVMVFCKFLQAFCCVKHPVVLLLDDWQWLDASSLEVIQILGSMEAISGLMIMGTCRDNEVSAQDSLSIRLRQLEDDHQVRIVDVQLSALSVEDVQAMVLDLLEAPAASDRDDESLSQSPSSSSCLRTLAERMHQLTGGNPFFIWQNMRALRAQNSIYYTYDMGWQWDMDALTTQKDKDCHCFEREQSDILDKGIQTMAETSNLMKETLITASFLGARFSFQHLSLVVATTIRDESTSAASIQAFLDLLVQNGLIDYDSSMKGYYRWAHDKFQRSAYSLVLEHNQASRNLHIGLTLLAILTPEETEEQSFLISNLCLRGLEYLVIPSERTQVAQHLLVAGIKAAASSAFHSAASFFAYGISLLPHRPWNDVYDLCLALHNGAIEMEYCIGNFVRSDELFSTVLQNTRSLKDQMRVYEARISSLSARHMDKDALDTGFILLKKLGEPLPRRASLPYTLYSLGKVVMWLRKHSTESILAAAPIYQWEKLSALRILQMICPPLMRSRGELSPIWAIRNVQITSRYGLSDMSAPIFLALSMILGTAVAGLPEDSKRCADISRQLEDRFHAPQWKCRMFIFESYAKWWHEPFTSSTALPRHISGVKAGLVSGDVELAYINSAFYCFYGLTTGIPLHEYISTMEVFHTQFSKLGQQTIFIELPMECARLLISDTTNLIIVAKQYGRYCDDRTKQQEEESGVIDPALLIISYFCQLFMCTYTHDWARGLRVWKSLRRLPIDAVYGPNWTAQIYFLVGVVEIMAAQATQKRIAKHNAAKRPLKLLKKLAEKMSCPDNVLNKIHCLQAERYVLKSNPEKAIHMFQQSIHFSSQSKYLHDEALAHERLADAWIRSGDTEEANASLSDATRLYSRWGCSTKAAACRSRMIH